MAVETSPRRPTPPGPGERPPAERKPRAALPRYARLIPYALREWRWFLSIAVMTGLSSAAAAAYPWPMKILVDYALGQNGLPPALQAAFRWADIEPSRGALVALAALGSLLIFAVSSLLGIGLSLSWNVCGQRMVYGLAADLFAHLQRLSILFHRRRSVGDSLSRLTGDTWCIYTVIDSLLVAPFQQAITLGTLIWIGFKLDPVLAWLALAVAPLLAITSRIFGKRLKKRAKLGREAQSRMLSFVHQTLRSIPLVKTFGTESRNSRSYRRLAGQAVELAQRGNLLGRTYGLVNGLITTLGVAVVLYVGSTRVLSGAITLGTLLVFLSYVRKMESASGGMFKIFTKLKSVEASIDRLLEVLDSDEIVPEAPGARPLPAPCRGHIRFEDVSFGYEPSRPVLSEVSLEARPGQVVALVGPTGAGKTTLASLVPRFFDPWQGRVTIDGVDIRDVSLSSLRSQVSVVFQEALLLPLTVAENIGYGRPDATRDEVIEAARAAQADEFIRRLPQGYDTVLGEAGACLSGGERQRLTIARALLKDAPVLILDEPTSALDARTEAALVAALRRLLTGRTALVIAHRLSTIRGADQIAVLDHGRLVEIGSHDQLLVGSGLYHRLYMSQFAGAAGQGAP
jgi:ABC-type multidrug transport system fused ATPase/permease subunit